MPSPRSGKTQRLSPNSIVRFFVSVMGFLWIAQFFLPAASWSQEDLNPKVETPESFTNRKKSNYEAGLQALQAKYNDFCRIPGGRPPGPGDRVQPPGGRVIVGPPPGQAPLPPGEQGEQEVFVKSPGDLTRVELERVITRYRDRINNPNPWDWADALGLLSASSSSTTAASGSSSSSNMACKGSSADAYIHINPSTKTCSVNTNPSGFAVNVYTMDGNPNGSVGYTTFGSSGWVGPSSSMAYTPPGVTILDSFLHTATNTTVTVQFRVVMSDPGKACSGKVTILHCK